jgi:transcriptional regulator
MYDLPYFKESDQRTVRDFIRAHPFAMLIGSSQGLPMATQVPVLIDEREGPRLFLRGHMMRNTDHHRAFGQNNEALCVFSGAHTYVSAVYRIANWIYLELHERACAAKSASSANPNC